MCNICSKRTIYSNRYCLDLERDSLDYITCVRFRREVSSVFALQVERLHYTITSHNGFN